jgi:hypothetical protein
VGHGEVRAEDPGEKGDLMARSNLDSADDWAEDERVVLVPVNPMPQWRPRPQAVRHRDGQRGEWKIGVRLRLRSRRVNEKPILVLNEGRSKSMNQIRNTRTSLSRRGHVQVYSKKG